MTGESGGQPGGPLGRRPGELWAQFAHDPRDRRHRSLRASDRDRDVVSAALGEAYADGRLDIQEFEERADRARAASRLGELPALLQDLVPASDRQEVERREQAAVRQEAELKYAEQRREAFSFFLVPSLICWGIYVAVFGLGGGLMFPWPLFVTLGTGWGWAELALGREARIARLEREIIETRRKKELKQRRRLRRKRPRPGGR